MNTRMPRLCSLASLVFFSAVVATLVPSFFLGTGWMLSSDGVLIVLIIAVLGLLLYQFLLADSCSSRIDAHKKDRHLLQAQQISSLCSWELDEHNRLSWSAGANDLFSVFPSSMADASWVDDEFLSAFLSHRQRAIIEGKSALTFRISPSCSKEGEERWVTEYAEHSPEDGLTGVLQDVTVARTAEKQLSLSDNVYRSMGDGVVITTPSGVIVDINPAMERISRHSKEDVIGKCPRIFHSGLHDHTFYRNMWRDLTIRGQWKGDITNKRRDGTTYIQDTTIEAICNTPGRVDFYVAVCKDVTERRALESKLWDVAYYDTLTGLANKSLFDRQLDALITERMQDNQYTGKIAILILDLDNLYKINDIYGTQVGDEVIKITGKRLLSAYGEKNGGIVVSRFGGDEFCVAKHSESVEAAEQFAKDVLRMIAAPVSVCNAGEVFITCSAGLTVFPDNKMGANTLVRHASHALHMAKTQGGNQFILFSPEDERVVQKHYDVIRKIERAMTNKEIVPFYQPKVDILTGQIVGAEALTRWMVDGTPVPPSEFIENIERCAGSLPARFTLYMAKAVAKDIRSWLDRGISIPVSINVFPGNLKEAGFSEEMVRIVTTHGIAPEMIEFEILESSDVGNRTVASDAMRQLRDLGFKLSIDDFGTGYSSLDYLRKLPVEALKIDQSFVISMNSCQEDEKIVSAVIRLANSLGFGVVAEGIEDHATAHKLASMGCRVGQGYYYSRPVPGDQFIALSFSAL